MTADVPRPELAGPQDTPAVQGENDAILALLATWTDDRLGPLLDLDCGALEQSPVGRAGVRFLVHDPAGVPVRRELVAAALSSREALVQAALNAAEVMVDPVAVAAGVGWSDDEARYRALLRAALREAVPETSWRPWEPVGPAEDDCARTCRYLLDTVEDPGPGPSAHDSGWQVAGSASGLVLARRPGRPTRGVGLCAAEAVSSALLHEACDGHQVLAAVRPHVAGWSALWDLLPRDRTAPAGPGALGFAAGELAVAVAT